MKYIKAELPDDLDGIKKTAEAAFSSTPDSSFEEWFSFSAMKEQIGQGRGICIKAVDENHNIVGMIYAQQENPTNSIEGTEKWVILIAAVIPEFTSKGIGTGLLQTLEQHVHRSDGKKMFVFTNENDEKVINFYKKNGYEYAGWIKDYQYGGNNSAVFLLKYL